MFSAIRVKPQTVRYDLLLTAMQPLSHHDPAVAGTSNRVLFNRRKQILPDPVADELLSQADLNTFSRAWPVPADLAPLLGGLDFDQFIAVAYVRLFLDLYGAGEGVGLFAGLARYERLETRLRTAATAAHDLRRIWDRLCRDLQVGIHPGDRDDDLLSFFALPRSLQVSVRRAFMDEYRSVVALARAWMTTQRLQSPEYAQKAGREVTSAGSVSLTWSIASTFAPGARQTILEVPAVSTNSLRHQVVRAPIWQHLATILELLHGQPGAGTLPAGAEALFVNGGNILKESSPSTNAFGLAQRIRERYPSIELLGGVTDSFTLGESRLKPAAWLVCRENAAALVGTRAADLPSAQISAFDLLDDVTATRQATLRGVGQMIYGFEALAQGTQILLRLGLDPDTSDLAHGALIAGVETFLGGLPAIGGQDARGYGVVAGEWLASPAEPAHGARERYEDYLYAHREELRTGLEDSTLGTGQRVLLP